MFFWHLEAIEFVVAQYSVIVLVGDVKYSAQRSDTKRFQLWKSVSGQRTKPCSAAGTDKRGKSVVTLPVPTCLSSGSYRGAVG